MVTSQIVVPARNEEVCLPFLLKELREEFGESQHIIVVDNSSSDSTAIRALEAGATLVVYEEKIGKGYAIRKGLESAEPGLVFICDADIKGLTKSMIQRLEKTHTESGALVSRLAIGRPPEFAPVTTLSARPLMTLLGLCENTLEEPIGGLVLVDRDFLLSQHLLGGWGFDFALTLRICELGLLLPEVRVTGVEHRYKLIVDYVEMAYEVLRAGLIAGRFTTWDHHDCIKCRTGKN